MQNEELASLEQVLAETYTKGWQDAKRGTGSMRQVAVDAAIAALATRPAGGSGEVERVARALYAETRDEVGYSTWNGALSFEQAKFHRLAQAAIAALATRPAGGSGRHIVMPDGLTGRAEAVITRLEGMVDSDEGGPLDMTEVQDLVSYIAALATRPAGGSGEVERVARAIEQAQCNGREGPFGGYDYGYNEAFYGPAPEGGRYVIRDFRDPASPDWGKFVHLTNDNDEHERMFKKMTREHIAQAAIAALAPRPTADGEVERVARALWRAEWADGHEPTETWETICAEELDRLDVYRILAQAAIAALRAGDGR